MPCSALAQTSMPAPPPPGSPGQAVETGKTPQGGEVPIAPAIPTGSPNAADAQAVVNAPPQAPEGTNAAHQTQEIVVTGTNIRGVAPVGSSVISVGQEQIKAVAPVTVSQLLDTVPAITTAGAAPQGENVYSYYSPQIHSLGGSASNSTLVIADGLRLPGGGTQYSETDPNIIPVSALERVEVLADGASSTYGSDAVAGVVNFIIRKRYDGLTVNLQGGAADHYGDRDANFVWGTHTDKSTVMIAGSYSYETPLSNNSRPYLSMGNYIPIGGSNMNSFSCSPATIRTPQSGSGVYLSPTATTTVVNTQANAPCNTSVYGDALPEQQRENVLVRASHDFTDKFTVTLTGLYNQQSTYVTGTPGTITGVNTYGTGVQANPFFTAPAGQPGATQESISYLALNPNGYGSTQSEEDVAYGTLVANYEITPEWSATLSDAIAKNRSSLDAFNTFCQACSYLALNGTGQASGSMTASDVSNQNVIATNLPLTAANALDVWNPASQSRTSAAVQRQLYSNNTTNTDFNEFNQARLQVQGPLFRVPAGELKAAFGGEIYNSTLQQDLVGAGNTGSTPTSAAERIYNYRRQSESGFYEFEAPLIGPEMGIPFIRKIDVDVSGRYDHFSDVGGTFNPKYAFNWEIVKGLKFRANYSTSFVAPPLAVIGDPSQGYLYGSGSVGTAGTIYVPLNTYPTVAQVPGCQGQTTTCELGLSNNQGLRRQLGGGFTNIQPETGQAWNIGMDWTPPFLPGFAANVTLFNNKFNGGATSPNPNSIVTSAGLHNQLTICPTGCSQAQIAAFANTAGGATISGTIPSSVYYLLDQDEGNVLNLNVQGIDFQFQYTYRTENFGSFRVGDALTYFTNFMQNFGGGENFSILNTSGYNTTFPSIQTHTRLNVGWTDGPFSLDTFVNYTGGYRNWSNTSVRPITTDALGNPTGGGDYVDPQLTVDLHVAYTLSQGWLNGDQIYVDVQNLLDQDPPFYNGNTSGILGGAAGFNGFVSNPIGRLVSLGVRANF
jgi:iron complex outermembrane recepter protein